MSTDRVRSIDVMGRWAVRRMVKYSAMNPCTTPPVCEFGYLGPEAQYWYPPHAWRGQRCSRCGEWKGLEPEANCRPNLGAYGMCGHRPYTGDELMGTSEGRRGDRMGQRPEVDTVNVVPCDRIADE